MRILFLGVIPTAQTAYGKNAASICSRLKKNHKVFILPNTGYFFGQAPLKWDGIPLLPREDIYNFSLKELEDNFRKYKIDIIFQHFCIWVWGDYFSKVRLPFATYTPVDSTNNPPHPSLSETLHMLCKNAVMNLAMSKFAYDSFRQSGLPAHLCPHGYDEKIYYPTDKKIAKKEINFGHEDKFVFGIVAINRPRKNVPNQMRAFKIFLEHNPDAKDSLLYVHSNPYRDTQGFNLLTIAKKLNIPKENIAFSHPDSFKNIREENMRNLYNSFDCLLSATLGEGFGLCILESMACGIPALVTDFGAMNELSEFTVKVKEWLCFEQIDSFFAIPDTEHMAEQMGKFYDSSSLRNKLRKKGLKKAKKYTWDKMIKNIEEGLKKATE